MTIRCLANVLASMMLLCAPALPAARQVHELPAMKGHWVSREGRDYSLRQAVLHPMGAAAGKRVSVTLVDVVDGTGEWDRPLAARLPPIDMAVPPSIRTQLHWFYGGVVGWMPVPSGWRLQYAARGADGNTGYLFVAPAGAASGWLTYGIIPACLSCLLETADGLLPGAYEQEVANGYVHGPGPLPLRPVPDRLAHPDDCTALLRYRTGRLTVRAAVLSSEPLAKPEGSLSEADVYVALPARQDGIAEAIVGNFRRRFAACHAPDGWPDQESGVAPAVQLHQ
jgi:hypothetical protein